MKGRMKPSKGQGERFLGCDYYEDCLSRAALENWPSWNCEACDLFKVLFPGGKSTLSEEENKSGNPRMCKECGIRPTIQPNSPYCATCLALKAKEARARKKQASQGALKPEKEKQGAPAALKSEKGPTQIIGQPEIVQPRGDLSLILSFKRYEDLLEKLRLIAEKDIRSVEGEAIYIIKAYLDQKEIEN